MTDDDVASILRLNQESVWAVSPLDAEGLATHRAEAAFALVCEIEGQVAAFAIAYAPGTSYGSVNYAWHSEQFDDFLYLDRIVVDPQFRRRGVAKSDLRRHGGERPATRPDGVRGQLETAEPRLALLPRVAWLP